MNMKKVSRIVATADSRAKDPVITPESELLPTEVVAVWLGVTVPWLESARKGNYGPSYIRIANRCVRYQRKNVQAWLDECRTAPSLYQKRA